MSGFNINEDAQSGGECSGSQSTNPDLPSQPTESAFPDEDEETITMLDVIEQENKLEEEASAVLGNSDEKNCTYPKGYISRQALYSCATCSEDPENMAAICLACSLECHDNHDVIELYTKRGYRCDCGNSKFKPDFVCKFQTEKQTKKAPLNEQNKYNHNFSGRYCNCDMRYPPDENDNSPEAHDEMLQCIICEDWYHSKHLGAKVMPAKFDELICSPCVGRLDFVHYYRDFIDISTINSADKRELIDTKPSDQTEEGRTQNGVANPELNTNDQETSQDTPTSQQAIEDSANVVKDQAPTTAVAESDTNDSQSENKDPSKNEPATDDHKSTVVTSAESAPVVAHECLLDKYKKLCELKADERCSTSTSGGQPSQVDGEIGPIFWTDCSWRTRLCRCDKCMLMYKSKECEYLLDEKDSVQYYEAQGRAIVRESPFERGMSALNRMNRTAVVEALHGYDELKADLSTYLRKFAETKKVVREEDIHDFFAQLNAKKRPRLEYE